MAITAFSKKFKRELDVKQFQNLYQQFPNELDLSDFTKTDIECPCCGVTGGRIVKEGISLKTKQAVKQAHFAFKKDDGGDSHLIFCDYYSGPDKENRITNDSNISLASSQNEVTQEIRKLVCSAIHNDIFQQVDIRNMRQWFLEMRSKEDFLVENSKHQLNLLKHTIIRSPRNKDAYTIDKNIVNEEWFDLDQEVYESLATKFPYPDKIRNIPGMNYLLTRRAIIKKAISISQKNHGLYEFDRNLLEEKYRIASQLSSRIIQCNDLLYQKLGHNIRRARSNNPLMAYSATLLFVNNWNIEKALKMHNAIACSTTENENLGNVIGLNPFIHYDAWIALNFSSIWKKDFIEYDFDHEFLKEKKRLKEIYQID